MRKLMLFSFVFTFISVQLWAQNGCPGCIVSVPNTLPEDTIYLATAANGQVGQFYDNDLSFRMPKTTTPVAAADSTTIPGLTINEITITSVTNLPPGLSWEANQRTFITADQTDGCVKFCGTPLQPGLYEVEVVVEARILVINQTTSFILPILIEPSVRTTDGFTVTNASGCGEVTVGFANNVPSGNKSGFTYHWDFGNGNTSTSENPANQTYTEPGEYAVDYQAIVDTTGYFLTRIEIASFSCSDIFGGKPDLQLEIYNPEGELAFKSDIVNNASAPTVFTMNVKLDTGNYAARVIDDDDGIFGGGDDECGTINFRQTTFETLRDGALSANFTIIHPVDTIASTDTVVVYPQPANPLVTGYEGSPLCDGDVVDLLSDYETDILWYRDSMSVLMGGTDALLTIEESGSYWVQYTSPDGCQAVSAPIDLQFAELPDNPIFLNTNNFLKVIDEITLPRDFALQWYLNDTALPNSNGGELCADASGSYELIVTDLETGCTNRFSRNVTFNPNFAGCGGITATEDQFNELVDELSVFPNPNNGLFWLELNTHKPIDIQVIVRNLLGSIVTKSSTEKIMGTKKLPFDIRDYAAGIYILEIRANDAYKQLKIVKQ